MELVKNEFPVFRIQKTRNDKGNIIFIHDFPDNSYIHSNIEKMIKDFNYLAVDLPGCGVTPIIQKSKINIYYQACLLVEWIHEKGFNNIVLIGHGIGSTIALVLANMIEGKINNLILINPPDHAMFKKMKTNNDVLIKSDIDKMTKIYSELFYRDVKGQVRDSLDIDHKLLLFKKKYKDLKILEKQLYNHRSFRDVCNAMKKNTLPTTIIVGKDNKYYEYNKAANWYKKQMKNIEILKFSNSSHYPFLEEPLEYFEIIKKLII